VVIISEIHFISPYLIVCGLIFATIKTTDMPIKKNNENESILDVCFFENLSKEIMTKGMKLWRLPNGSKGD
jgi:hypothetical protein